MSISSVETSQVAFAEVPPEIRSLLNTYFDVLHHQNLEQFDRVFHPSCALYGIVDGQLNIRSYSDYRDAVARRASPASLGEFRDDQVLDFDQISENVAWVKPQLQMFGGVMQDYLNLLRVDGQWWIVAKLWERVGDVAEVG